MRSNRLRAVATALLAFVVVGAAGCTRRPARTAPAAKRAFYYWRTTLRLSAVEAKALGELAIDRLYLRLFDVDWSEPDKGARPLGLLTGDAGDVPASTEIVPVVFLRARVLQRLDAPRTAALADDVWRAATGIMHRLGRRAGELQLDCDWTDSTRERYFAFLAALGERARPAKTTLTATIRLHQIKYRERTGVPPVGRGMLMVYNMGRIDADDATNAIYDPAAAERYLARVADYPLPLDVALPIWSWVVHLRGGVVEGLLQDVDPAGLAGLPWLRRVGPHRFEVAESTFLHGELLRAGDLLDAEETTGATTRAAGEMIAARLPGRDAPVLWRCSIFRSATLPLMRPRIWLACSLAFASALAGAPRAWACGGGDDEYGAADRTTFDPAVIDDPSEAPLFFDPQTTAIGSGPCAACAVAEMKEDWQAFLGTGVTAEDWARVLLSATVPEIDGLILTLQGKSDPPAGFEQSSLLKGAAGAERERRLAALTFAGFARRVEPDAAPPPGWGAPRPTPKGDPAALQASGEKALQRAKLPFLRQRYAFQLLRLRFYRNDWKGVAAFHDQQRAALESPSRSLAWRARYYLAGALRRDGELARANLLLARVQAGAPALASVAALDFRPMEQADWKATLALAASTGERVELWRLVGLKLDALEATRQIVALDPRSKRVALLAVRELNRAEVQANDKALADLEALARRLADAPTTDRRWVFNLVAGHAAALRGDLAAARPRLERAMKARPGTLAETQAWASLALALSKTRPDARTADELARALEHVPADFSRRRTLEHDVRARLATAYQAGGLCVEARLFGRDDCAAKWSDPRFVEAMIARVASPATAFDHFMVAGSGYSREGLERELALLHFARGDLEKASRILRGPKGEGGVDPLRTEPFAFRIRDCHSCDRADYAQAKWTSASFIARVIALRSLAQNPGEAGAAAAFALGNAYYNITALGSARGLLEGTHVSIDPRQAEAWYKQAYDRTRDRELKIKAAYLAAKSELGRRLPTTPGRPAGPVDPLDNLPIATDWFPIVKRFADTAYHREILRECGTYRRWAAAN